MQHRQLAVEMQHRQLAVEMQHIQHVWLVEQVYGWVILGFGGRDIVSLMYMVIHFRGGNEPILGTGARASGAPSHPPGCADLTTIFYFYERKMIDAMIVLSHYSQRL